LTFLGEGDSLNTILWVRHLPAIGCLPAGSCSCHLLLEDAPFSGFPAWEVLFCHHLGGCFSCLPHLCHLQFLPGMHHALCLPACLPFTCRFLPASGSCSACLEDSGGSPLTCLGGSFLLPGTCSAPACSFLPGCLGLPHRHTCWDYRHCRCCHWAPACLRFLCHAPPPASCSGVLCYACVLSFSFSYVLRF